jgi:DamX protein
MADDGALTYSKKKSLNELSNKTDHSLITQERKQKLELLIHLLTHLTEALVICGPSGIGKTTMLQALYERKMSAWRYCPIQGNAELSFENIHEHITKIQKQRGAQGKANKIVVLIDNAGDLVPGLLTSLIQYSWTNPLIRLVFVLTLDELHIKGSTDQLIDECHFIEIPPLSEYQCGEFLQQLSTKSWARLALININDYMIQTVYKESHGIPGKIIAQIPNLKNTKKTVNSLSILIATVLALTGATIVIQWLSAQNAITAPTPPPTLAKLEIKPTLPPINAPAAPALPIIPESAPVPTPLPAAIEPPQQKSPAAVITPLVNPVISAPPLLVTQQNLPTNQATTKELKDIPAPKKDTTLIETIKPPVVPEIKPLSPEKIAPTPKVEKVEQTITPEIPQLKSAAETPASDDKDWINSAPTTHYTLQVMLLSKEQGIKDIKKKYPALAKDIKFLKKIINNQERFLLFYGLYPNAIAAQQAKQLLPREFNRSLIKKLNNLQK